MDQVICAILIMIVSRGKKIFACYSWK